MPYGFPMSVRIRPGECFYEQGKPGYTVVALAPSKRARQEGHPICMGTADDYWECLVTFADGSTHVDPGLMLTINGRVWLHSACTRVA